MYFVLVSSFTHVSPHVRLGFQTVLFYLCLCFCANCVHQAKMANNHGVNCPFIVPTSVNVEVFKVHEGLQNMHVRMRVSLSPPFSISFHLSLSRSRFCFCVCVLLRMHVFVRACVLCVRTRVLEQVQCQSPQRAHFWKERCISGRLR